MAKMVYLTVNWSLKICQVILISGAHAGVRRPLTTAVFTEELNREIWGFYQLARNVA